MLCTRCEALSQGRAGRSQIDTLPVWGADQIRDVKCTLCGTTLDADDIARLLAEKHSQLAQFGLVGPTHPPVAPKPPISVE